MTDKTIINQRKPEWLKIKLPKTEDYSDLKKILKRNNLHTICESGKCPNIGECWADKTATFMILGNICTRSCKFCSVEKGKPLPADEAEPKRIAKAVSELKLKHCVITSVHRDDLKDGGAKIWAETVTEIKKNNKDITIETLIPDFEGKYENLKILADSNPDIISHNIETVRRLTKEIRVVANYDRSLEVLKKINEFGKKSKTGILLGVGENEDDILKTFDDILKSECFVLTMGQYLQPTRNQIPVKKFYSPLEFEKLKNIAISKGFKCVESSPLTRSSYHSKEHIK